MLFPRATLLKDDSRSTLTPRMPKIHKTTTIITFPLKLVATCLYFSLSKITRSLSTVIAEDVRKDTAQNTNVMKKHVTRE